ncbi:MAG: NUDIX domain-containing protein [bacterium]|nr:NUDIX domain-containing protein [bacterium]
MSHIHEKIDFTVETFIVFRNKVLLRIHDKFKIWLSVGGHVELNEDPNEAAIREAKEEVGLDITLFNSSNAHFHEKNYRDLIPPIFLSRNRPNPTHEHVTMIYFATATNDQTRQPDNHEKTEECRWFTKEELEKSTDPRLPENVRFYALAALAAVGV